MSTQIKIKTPPNPKLQGIGRMWPGMTGVVEEAIAARDAQWTEAVRPLVEAMQELMQWQVKHVELWHNQAYDNAHRALSTITEA